MLPCLIAGSIFVSGRSQGAWNIYSTANSLLPWNTVRCIVVDTATNLKWIGTDYGLASFDGTTWATYTTVNSSIPDDAIRSLAIDENGDLWAGTLQSGVAKFDGAAWTIYDMSNSGIPDNMVKAVAFDTAGNLWVGTPSGLGKFDWSTWTTWNISNSTLISHNITCITIGKNNIKRIGTLNGGLAYYNDTAFTVYSYWTGTLPENTVTSVDIDSTGKPWVAMNASGIIVHYGGPAWVWMNTINSSIQSDVINHIHVSKDQKKYISTMDKGIIIYNGTTFVNYDSANSPFPDSWATCAVKDTAGIVWIGTLNEGLVRLDESILNGVQEQALPDDIILGPIPTPDKFTVYSTGMFKGVTEFLLCDIHGNILIRKKALPGVCSMEFDISHLAPGYYVFFTQGRRYNFRVIKS